MSELRLPITCDQFESRVSDYIERTISSGDRAAMDAHVAQCAHCQTLLADVRAIVIGAASLPLLEPSRDLWSGIAERLDTPVVAIGASKSTEASRSRHISFRVFAAAALLLITVSSGVTYMLARETSTQPEATPVVASTQSPTVTTRVIEAPVQVSGRTTLVVPPATRVVTPLPDAERPRSRYASNSGSVELVYEREIAAMRRIVDERLGDLDSATVVEIERNLRIIDKAINDSRRALQSDPRSRFLSTQLDRALENKLGVLRRIALL